MYEDKYVELLEWFDTYGTNELDWPFISNTIFPAFYQDRGERENAHSDTVHAFMELEKLRCIATNSLQGDRINGYRRTVRGEQYLKELKDKIAADLLAEHRQEELRQSTIAAHQQTQQTAADTSIFMERQTTYMNQQTKILWATLVMGAITAVALYWQINIQLRQLEIQTKDTLRSVPTIVLPTPQVLLLDSLHKKSPIKLDRLKK